MARNQRSIKSAVEFDGIALHSGEAVHVRIAPAPAGTGVVFKRTDVDDPSEVPANADYLVNSQRRTTLRRGGSEISMVEHLLSAAHGMGVDNLYVEVDGPELPGLDGSCSSYIKEIRKGVIVEQKSKRARLQLDEPVYVRDGDMELVALPPTGEGLRIRYIPEYPDGVDASNVCLDLTPESYEKEIAPARTFVRSEEVEKLLAAGYGKGANAENTVVLGGDEESELRLELEPTRHKIADLIGDLALVGVDICADIIATRSGHALNQELARELLLLLHAQELTEEDTREDGYDIRDIMRILPHRYPFLLVDRVIEVQGTRRAVGLKNVTINEEFFQGHWPEHPVMPGVLQLEAMAQVAGILLLRKLEHSGKIAVLASIDKVRFRGSVVPGDQLRIEVETLRLNRNRGQVVGTTKVGRRLAAEATLSFALVDA